MVNFGFFWCTSGLIFFSGSVLTCMCTHKKRSFLPTHTQPEFPNPNEGGGKKDSDRASINHSVAKSLGGWKMVLCGGRIWETQAGKKRKLWSGDARGGGFFQHSTYFTTDVLAFPPILSFTIEIFFPLKNNPGAHALKSWLRHFNTHIFFIFFSG